MNGLKKGWSRPNRISKNTFGHSKRVHYFLESGNSACGTWRYNEHSDPELKETLEIPSHSCVTCVKKIIKSMKGKFKNGWLKFEGKYHIFVDGISLCFTIIQFADGSYEYPGGEVCDYGLRILRNPFNEIDEQIQREE